MSAGQLPLRRRPLPATGPPGAAGPAPGAAVRGDRLPEVKDAAAKVTINPAEGTIEVLDAPPGHLPRVGFVVQDASLYAALAALTSWGLRRRLG